MCANSKGSGETARMCMPAWAFAGRLCDKYHNLRAGSYDVSLQNALVNKLTAKPINAVIYMVDNLILYKFILFHSMLLRVNCQYVWKLSRNRHIVSKATVEQHKK